MVNFMGRFSSQTYALLRIVTGFLFLWHGVGKVFQASASAPFLITYIGGPIELVGGVLIMLGLFVRPTAFLCSGQMAVAYWMSHGTKALLPIENKGELAVLYCFVFFFISAQGSGIWSLDAARKGSS